VTVGRREYRDGIKLGQALRGKREGVFLACKTGLRDAAGARAELERSLERAHSERFDLYQFHAVTKLSEVREILGPGGAGETFLKAREEGKVRFLGASCHSAEAALAHTPWATGEAKAYPRSSASPRRRREPEYE
jgi:predicted aldo/keto reductase-like oxidoreductase